MGVNPDISLVADEFRLQSTGGFARILLAGMVGGQGYLGVSVFFGTDDSNKWGVDENSQIFDQINIG